MKDAPYEYWMEGDTDILADFMDEHDLAAKQWLRVDRDGTLVLDGKPVARLLGSGDDRRMVSL